MLLVVDDLQWADGESLALLVRVARTGRGPLLVLATARPATAHPVRAALDEIGRALPLVRLDLAGLRRGEVSTFAADRGVDADVEDLLVRTAGNPFFLEALLAEGGERTPLRLIETIAARAARLGPEPLAVLRAAALLGRTIDAELAAEVAGTDPLAALDALDAAQRAGLVDRVAASGGAGAAARGGAAGGGRRGWRGGAAGLAWRRAAGLAWRAAGLACGTARPFAHALVQDALLEGLGAGDRARLHSRAAEALARRADAGDQAALVAAARQALAGSPPFAAAEAIDLAIRAGAALLAPAPAAAAEVLERALGRATAAGERVLADELRCRLGEALAAAERPDEARAAFEAAAAGARARGDAELLARTALGAAGPGVTILRVDEERVADLDEALTRSMPGRHRCAPACRRASRSSSPTRPTTSGASGSARPRVEEARALGRPPLARRRARRPPRRPMGPRAHARAARAGRRDARARPPLGRSRAGAAGAHVADRRPHRARRRCGARRRARRLRGRRRGSGLTVYGWYVPAWRAMRASLRRAAGRSRAACSSRPSRSAPAAGDGNAVLVSRLGFFQSALADEAFEDVPLDLLEERIRTSPAGWAYRQSYIWTLAALGREDEARAQIEVVRAAGGPSAWPRDTNWISAVQELAEAAWLLRERELGGELYALAAPFADRIVSSTRALHMIGPVAGVLGRLDDLLGDAAAAAAHYEDAIARSRRAGAPVWAVRDTRRLGELLCETGTRPRAPPGSPRPRPRRARWSSPTSPPPASARSGARDHRPPSVEHAVAAVRPPAMRERAQDRAAQLRLVVGPGDRGRAGHGGQHGLHERRLAGVAVRRGDLEGVLDGQSGLRRELLDHRPPLRPLGRPLSGAAPIAATASFTASRSQSSGRPKTWITTRAPGRATRAASRSAATTSSAKKNERKPVTTSKASSPNGNPAGPRGAGRPPALARERSQKALARVEPATRAPRSAHRRRKTPAPQPRSRTRSPRSSPTRPSVCSYTGAAVAR